MGKKRKKDRETEIINRGFREKDKLIKKARKSGLMV